MKSRVNIWLLLAVALCAISLWAGWRPDRDEADESMVDDDPGTAHLLVLNGTGRPGLAREISLLLGPAGCVVEGVGNAPGKDWPRCLLVNRRMAPVRASRLAERLGGVAVVREWDDRATEDAVLVLGEDWHGVRRALTGEKGGIGENLAK